jgi:hypothetical protein
MKTITQSLESEGNNHQRLNYALKDFFAVSPFANGFDWQSCYLWATMTDEQCLLFCLKHPEYTERFREA